MERDPTIAYRHEDKKTHLVVGSRSSAIRVNIPNGLECEQQWEGSKVTLIFEGKTIVLASVRCVGRRKRVVVNVIEKTHGALQVEFCLPVGTVACHLEEKPFSAVINVPQARQIAADYMTDDMARTRLARQGYVIVRQDQLFTPAAAQQWAIANGYQLVPEGCSVQKKRQRKQKVAKSKAEGSGPAPDDQPAEETPVDDASPDGPEAPNSDADQQPDGQEAVVAE
ncbi:MAG: hypothetical protein WCX61_03330 [Candidatus Peribacteraceae bacterium]